MDNFIKILYINERIQFHIFLLNDFPHFTQCQQCIENNNENGMNTKHCQNPNNKFGVMNGLDFQIPFTYLLLI